MNQSPVADVITSTGIGIVVSDTQCSLMGRMLAMLLGSDRPRRPFVVFILVLLGILAAPLAAIAQSSPSSFTTGTRYDADRRVTGTIAPSADGSAHWQAVRNTYDVSGRLVSVEKGELTVWQSEAVAPTHWTGFQVFSRVDMDDRCAPRMAQARRSLMPKGCRTASAALRRTAG